jgi:hypothetical protein
MSEFGDKADSAIEQVEIAALALIEFRRKKFLADQAKDDELDALVNSLLGQPNAETNKPHSVSSATVAAKKLESYRTKEAFALECQNEATLAENKLLQVQLRAKLAVNLVGIA